MTKLVRVFAALIWVAEMAMAQTQATIEVHPDQVIGPVNRGILGTNMIGYQYDFYTQKATKPEYSDRGAGIWDPDARRPVPEMVGFCKETGVTFSRWPGGCGSHNFNWKKAVGPLADRPNQTFGLPEFLTHCAAIGGSTMLTTAPSMSRGGATPVITLAEYWGEPQDGADLVEYLNSPVGGGNPNGGTDWAAMRAADGHPEPWRVTWIEFGNESDHGNHHGKRYTPEEYADRYLAYRKAMKAVDPNIRLGAVLENVSNGKFGEWTKTVLARAGKEMDFAIHHAYLPGYSKNTDPPLIARKLFPASWAAPAQWTMDYRALRRLMRDLTGREDIPLAITEFNGSFVQQKPVPYRLCLGNALINAELVRVLMQPEFKITLANFWQFANEYWGSVKGYAPPYVKRPNYYVFQLYAQHFGDTLVRADVKCETYDSDGGWGMMPARGKPEEFKLLPGNLLPPQPWKINEVAGVKQREENGVLIAEITTDADLNYYHAQMQMDALPLTGYRLTGEIRTEGLERSRGAQLQIGDARGWTATHSCALTPQVRSGEWATVTADYVTLPDAKAVTIQPRRLEGTGSTGKLYFRNVNIVRFIPENLGAVPYLGVNASMSVDGRKCCLMVVNKSLDNAISATITGVRARAARARTLTGPAVDATNEKDPNTVALRDLPITMTDGSASASFPPCSVTAVELDL